LASSQPVDAQRSKGQDAPRNRRRIGVACHVHHQQEAGVGCRKESEQRYRVVGQYLVASEKERQGQQPVRQPQRGEVGISGGGQLAALEERRGGTARIPQVVKPGSIGIRGAGNSRREMGDRRPGQEHGQERVEDQDGDMRLGAAKRRPVRPGRRPRRGCHSQIALHDAVCHMEKHLVRRDRRGSAPARSHVCRHYSRLGFPRVTPRPPHSARGSDARTEREFLIFPIILRDMV